jgi:Zn-dependent protease with chaperone function
LPGGIVVVTDELVRVLGNDAQISAMLAHEIEHVRHRHALRETLQAAGAAALVSAAAGDAVSITTLATTLPTLLLERGYSRAFEDEADTFAFANLKQVGIPRKACADALTALEQAHPASRVAASSADSTFDYLSTHPPTAQRIARASANE